MWRALAIVLACIGLAGPGLAKQLRTTGRELFCLQERDLQIYLALRHTKEFKDYEVSGCVFLKSGLRYTVLDRKESGVVRVSVLLARDETADGYMMDVRGR